MRRSRLVALAVTGLLLAGPPAFASGILVPTDGSPPISAHAIQIRAEVADGVARTVVRHSFVNPGDHPIEAVFEFPLPEGASLTGVATEAGGQRLEGLLVERQRARRIYDEIRKRKDDPALVEQIGRNWFRLSVFPVMPDRETVVELTWIQSVPLEQGEYRYRYPLATAGGDGGATADLSASVLFRSSVPFAAVTPGMPGMKVVSPEPGLSLATFVEKQAVLDRDLVVTARLAVEKPVLRVTTWQNPYGEGVFLVRLTPPPAEESQLVPRDVILVCDTSGSMEGEKLEQAKAAARFLLDHLRPADRVNLIRFSTDVTAFADAPVAPTPENLTALRAFVDDFTAQGTTAFGRALEKALDVPPKPGRARTVVFLTDGLPTLGPKNPADLIRIARTGAGRGLRVFPFGIGNDVDGGLLYGIAAATGGRAEIFFPGHEVKSRLVRFLTRTEKPVLTDLALDIEGLLTHDVLPRPIPDTYLGEETVVAGRYVLGGQRELVVTANFGGKPATFKAQVDFPMDPGGDFAARYLFATRKLAALEDQLRLRLNLPDAAYYAALDAGAYSTADEIVNEMVNVSLEFGVQCPYTCFLALLPEDKAKIDPMDTAAIQAALAKVQAPPELPLDAGPGGADGKAGGTVPAGAKAASGEGGAGAPKVTVPAEKPDAKIGDPLPKPKGGEAPGVDPGATGGGETAAAAATAEAGDAGNYRGPAAEVPPSKRAEDDPPPPPPPPPQPGADGRYRGACGGAPPGERDPDDPQPPPEGGGEAGADAGSGSGSDASGSAESTAPPTAPSKSGSNGVAGSAGVGAGAGPGGGRRSAPKPITFDNWIFWWSYNKDAILATRARTLANGGNATEDPEVAAALLRSLRTAVVNAELGYPVRRAALLALARRGGVVARDTLVFVATHRSFGALRDDAVVGLGLLPPEPDERIRDLLTALTANRELPAALRARAALALGLRREVGDTVFPALRTALEGGGASRDLAACAILGIGLSGDTSRVPELLGWLVAGQVGSRKLDDTERAWLVCALGKLGDVRALPALERAARFRDLATRRAVPVGYGGILAHADEATQKKGLETIARLAAAEPDATARGLYLVALGRLGRAAESEAVAKVARKVLEKWFADGDPDAERPYAALALGLSAMEGAGRGLETDPVRAGLADRIRPVLAKRKGEPASLGALALALGMLRDERPETVGLLTTICEDRSEDRKLRGAAATALGMIGGREAEKTIAKTLGSRADRALWFDSATSAGILGSPAGSAPLLGLWQKSEAGPWVLGAAASALGRVAGPEAVTGLIGLLEPETAKGAGSSVFARAMAATALGRIASRGGPRALDRLSADFLWRVTTPVLTEVLSLP